jgi:hypothetical protein
MKVIPEGRTVRGPLAQVNRRHRGDRSKIVSLKDHDDLKVVNSRVKYFWVVVDYSLLWKVRQGFLSMLNDRGGGCWGRCAGPVVVDCATR